MRLYPFFVLSILLILTCDDPVSPAKEEIPEEESFIQGIISDHRFNNRLIGVKVSWYDGVSLQTTFTDSLGYYSASLSESGNGLLYPLSYLLTFQFPDYATAYQNVQVNSQLSPLGETAELDSLANFGAYSNFNVVVQNIELYSLNASIGGKVFGDLPQLSIDNILVQAKFDDLYNLSPDMYTTYTDSMGNYIFVNLPAVPEVTISTAPIDDGNYLYSSNEIVHELIPD